MHKARAMNMAEMQSLEWQLQEMTESKNEEWSAELQQWRQTVQLAASQMPPVMEDYHSLPQDPFGYAHGGGGMGGVGAASAQQQMYAQRMQRSHEMMQHNMMRQVHTYPVLLWRSAVARNGVFWLCVMHLCSALYVSFLFSTYIPG